MSIGGQTVIISTVIDINTAEILSSSRLQMRRIDEIFDKLPPFVEEMVKNLPRPQINYFVGKWQGYGNSSISTINNQCIIEFKPDMTIVVEKYHTTVFGGGGSKNVRRESINGTGTGTYSLDSDQKITITLNLRNVENYFQLIRFNGQATFSEDKRSFTFPKEDEDINKRGLPFWYDTDLRYFNVQFSTFIKIN